MLSVRHLQASYGAAQVLFDISLEVSAGEVVTLLGRNGMGKTTTIRSIMGLLRPGGEVRGNTYGSAGEPFRYVLLSSPGCVVAPPMSVTGPHSDDQRCLFVEPLGDARFVHVERPVPHRRLRSATPPRTASSAAG